MAQFWKASSVTVNNGSKIVTVNTGDNVANIITNSMLQISNFQYVEVKTVNTVNQTIELFFPWDKGNVSAQPAIAAPNRAAIKEAVEELRALRQTYEGLAGDVSVAASANSIPRRDSDGRVKTATPSANEDAVNKGFLGSAATRNVGTGPGNVLEVGAFGVGGVTTTTQLDLNAGDYIQAGMTILSAPVGDLVNGPVDNAGTSRYIVNFAGNSSTGVQTVTNRVSGKSWFRVFSSGVILTDWQELYHSGNTNFDEFGGFGASDFVAIGYGFNSDTVMFYLPSFAANIRATSISVTDTFEILSKSFGSFATSVIPSLNSAQSGNRLTAVSVTGLSSVVQGDVYYLRQTSNNSKIKVNY